MVSTRVKGAKYENLAKKMLENQGWRVFRVAGSTKWSKSVDVWGLFDLVCILHGKLKFVQVKLNRRPKLSDYDEFWEENRPGCGGSCMTVECWSYFQKGKRKKVQGWDKIIWE